MSHIADDQLKILRNELESQKKDLQERIAGLNSEDPFADEKHLSINEDDAVEQSDHQRLQALRDESQRSLDRIETALQKIDEGTYGGCESCGAEINPKRLEIDPAAPLCIKCQEVQVED